MNREPSNSPRRRPVEAYLDETFLTSCAARALRMLAELMGTASRYLSDLR